MRQFIDSKMVVSSIIQFLKQYHKKWKNICQGSARACLIKKYLSKMGEKVENKSFGSNGSHLKSIIGTVKNDFIFQNDY